jgi:hypothetical protein
MNIFNFTGILLAIYFILSIFIHLQEILVCAEGKTIISRMKSCLN